MSIYIQQVRDIALSNKYSKWYCQIVSRAQLRATSRKQAKEICGYIENHHILPRSFKMGGEKDKLNYAYVTAEEHLLCHWLLSKMFVGDLCRKMANGFHKMMLCQNSHQQRTIPKTQIYARARLEAVKKMKGMVIPNSQKQSMKENSYWKGKTFEQFTDQEKANSKRFLKGNEPWNKGKTGLQTSWCSGITKEDPRWKQLSDRISGSKNPQFGKTGSKSCNFGNSPAKDPKTGKSLGRISTADPRWQSGEIVGMRKKISEPV